MKKKTLPLFAISLASLSIGIISSGMTSPKRIWQKTEDSKMNSFSHTLNISASQRQQLKRIFVERENHLRGGIDFVFSDRENINLSVTDCRPHSSCLNAIDMNKKAFTIENDTLRLALDSMLANKEKSIYATLKIELPAQDWDITVADKNNSSYQFSSTSKAKNNLHLTVPNANIFGNYTNLTIWNTDNTTSVDLRGTNAETITLYGENLDVRFPRHYPNKDKIIPKSVSLFSDKKSRLSLSNFELLERIQWQPLTSEQRHRLQSIKKPQ